MAAAVGMVHQIDRRKCRAAAEQRFSFTRVAADYERLYQEILEHPRRLAADMSRRCDRTRVNWRPGGS